MRASPFDETVGIDSLDCAAAAGSHDECWLRGRRPVLPPDVRPIGEAHGLRERGASRTRNVCGDGHRSQPTDASIEEDDEGQQAQGDEESGQRHAEVRHGVVLDPPEHREREREGANENRERRLQQAVAEPEAHDAGRERPGRHLHDENGHRDHETSERSRRTDDRRQHRARGRRRVLPQRRVPDVLVGERDDDAETRTEHGSQYGEEPEAFEQTFAQTEPPGPSHIARPRGATSFRRRSAAPRRGAAPGRRR